MVRVGLGVLAATLCIGSLFFPTEPVLTGWTPPSGCPWTVEQVEFEHGAPPVDCLPDLPRSLDFPDVDATANDATWRAFSWTADPKHYRDHVVSILDDLPPKALDVPHPSRRTRTASWHPWTDAMLIEARDLFNTLDATPRDGTWLERRAILKRNLDWGMWVHRHRPDMEIWRTEWREKELSTRRNRVVRKLRAVQAEHQREMHAYRRRLWGSRFARLLAIATLLALIVAKK